MHQDEKLFDRAWIKLALTLYILEVLFLLISGTGIFGQLAIKLGLPIPQFTGSYFQIVTQIYVNNLIIAVFEVIPIIGVLKFFTATLFTGFIISYKATLFVHLYDQTILFVQPILWLESIAYALATAESIYLLMAIFKKHFKKELKRAMWVIVIMIFLLYFSALLESVAIHTYNVYYTGLHYPYYIYYLALVSMWIPIIIALILVCKWKKEYAAMVTGEITSMVHSLEMKVKKWYKL